MSKEARVPVEKIVTRLQLRLFFGTDTVLGPGKAELLERIGSTGSISAAARAMAMSYKRAWMLVDELNTAFRDEVVERARGGTGGGGARLTATGERVLAGYRAIEVLTMAGAADEINAIKSLLRDVAEQK